MTMTHNSKWGGILVATMAFGWVVGSSRALAQPIEFDFEDPKRVNSIVFILDSTLEPIVGVASGINGKVNFDPKDPKAANGEITVKTKNLHVENKGMKDTIHDKDWLDAEKNPAISFKFKEIKEVKATKDNAWDLQVVGELTIRGVTKPVNVTVKANYLKDKMESRGGKQKGDILALRSDFSVKRKDFGIKPDMNNDVVAEEIQLKVSIVGFARK